MGVAAFSLHADKPMGEVDPRCLADHGYGVTRWVARPGRPRHYPQLILLGLADCVQVEVVVRLLGEEVNELVRGAEPVGTRKRHRVLLGPHDLVAEQPTRASKPQCHPLWPEQQTL